MSVYRVTLFLFLLFSFVQPAPALAQARENIVLLPIEVSPEYANQENLIGIALQQSLNKNFNVFYGDSVEAALQAEYAKEDCSAESCVQNIAILFNGEIIVDASVQRVENSAFLSVQFRNVITGELEAVVQDACRECSFTQLIDFIDERVSDIALNSSQGLTALLEKQAKPLTSSVATPQREQPKPSVTVSQEPINPRPKPTNSQPKVAKSPSYWKWGLGALALAAGGGGGGGGSNDAPKRIYAGKQDFGGRVAASGPIYFDGLYRNGISAEISEGIAQSAGEGLAFWGIEITPGTGEFEIQRIRFHESAGFPTFTDLTFHNSAKFHSAFSDNHWILINVADLSTAIFGIAGLKLGDGPDPSYIHQAFYSGLNTTGEQMNGQLPTMGTYSFSGSSLGALYSGTHQYLPDLTVSSIGLSVNFSTNVFELGSQNTFYLSDGLTAPELDFFAIGAHVNGELTATSLTGEPGNRSFQLRATAFGQDGNEFAGVFDLRSADNSSYIGAFGVK